jgi:hypothetical protein
MNKVADRDQNKMIVLYPLAQGIRRGLLGTISHTWNSKLGTLSDFDPKFHDDVQFIKQVHQWTMRNTNADPNNFHLGGFSEGALMAINIGQTGEIPINCLCLASATITKTQQERHAPEGKGPRNVFLVVNTKDENVLPPNPDVFDVKLGDLATLAKAGGMTKLGESKPLAQIPYFVNDALAGGGKYKRRSEKGPGYERDTYIVTQKDGTKKDITVDRVEGEHAWHGSETAGMRFVGMPRLDYPLSENIAKYLRTHRIERKLRW